MVFRRALCAWIPVVLGLTLSCGGFLELELTAFYFQNMAPRPATLLKLTSESVLVLQRNGNHDNPTNIVKFIKGLQVKTFRIVNISELK